MTKLVLTSTKFWMSLVWAINTMMGSIAHQIITDTGIGTWTLKAKAEAFVTTLLSDSSESRKYHLEAIFICAPRICDIFQCDIVGLRNYDSILTNTGTSLVTADAFLKMVHNNLVLPILHSQVLKSTIFIFCSKTSSPKGQSSPQRNEYKFFFMYILK